MESKRFKEYKLIIEEAIRQADLTENVSIQSNANPLDGSIFLSTNRARDCMLLVDGPEIQVLKRQPMSGASLTFKTCDIINLAEPGSVIQLGVAIKDLLNFSYFSKSDELG